MRSSIKQVRHNYSWQRLLVAALALVLVASGWWYIDDRQQVMLPIENVKLEGDLKQLSPIVLREKIAGVLHGGYFTIDLGVIRGALLELPWVQDVSIRRQWPLGLYIRVKEKTALARWGEQSLISDQGVLFTPANSHELAQLPELAGPDGLHGTVIEFYNELNDQLAPYGFSVASLSLDQRRAWTLKLSSDIEIKLGRNDVASRLHRLISVLSIPEVIDMRRVEVIDMRYPNGFAMRTDKKETNSTRITEA